LPHSRPQTLPEKKEEEALPTVSLHKTGAAQIRYSAVGAGLREAVSGKTAKFEIHARDENGLLVPSLAKYEVRPPLPLSVPSHASVCVTASASVVCICGYDCVCVFFYVYVTVIVMTDHGLQVSFTGPRPVYAPDVKPHPELKGVYVVEYQVCFSPLSLSPVRNSHWQQTVAPGTYHMTVTADGKPIEGSPFEVTVSGLAREQSKATATLRFPSPPPFLSFSPSFFSSPFTRLSLPVLQIEPKREEEKESLPTVHLNRPSGPQIKYSVAPHGSINGHKEATAGKPAKFEIHARDENGLLTPTKARCPIPKSHFFVFPFPPLF
jgi:hypothetical protein